MIYVITGKIGGGKTLFALTKVMATLSRGGCVVSNIALDEVEVDKRLKRLHGRRLVEGQIQFHDFEQEPEFQNHVPFGVPELPVMVVCDETQLYYNQAQSNTLQARLMRLLSFLTQSRKCSVDVWFITQHDTTIWAQFRHQALFGYKCRDMRVVTLPFVGQVGALGLTWVKYDIISGELMERGRTPLSKDLFCLYDTRQMYDSQMRELQKSAKVWQPVKKSAKGKYENLDNRVSVRWWSRFLRVQDGNLLHGSLRRGEGEDSGQGAIEAGTPDEA